MKVPPGEDHIIFYSKHVSIYVMIFNIGGFLGVCYWFGILTSKTTISLSAIAGPTISFSTEHLLTCC